MNYWRMSFRYGSGGESALAKCIEKGVAAANIFNDYNEPLPDLRDITESTFSKLWEEGEYNSPTARMTMCGMRYRMGVGDVIYAKENREMVSCGIITSEYDYDPNILDGEFEWPHFVRVNWDLNFKPVQALLGAERITLLRLNEGRIAELKRILEASGQSLLVPPVNPYSVYPDGQNKLQDCQQWGPGYPPQGVGSPDP